MCVCVYISLVSKHLTCLLMGLLIFLRHPVLFHSPDVFGAVLRGGQPLQEPAHLHRVHRGDVQGQETPGNAPSHLRHIRGGLPQHVARLLSAISDLLPTARPDARARPYACYQLRLGLAFKCPKSENRVVSFKDYGINHGHSLKVWIAHSSGATVVKPTMRNNIFASCRPFETSTLKNSEHLTAVNGGPGKRLGVLSWHNRKRQLWMCVAARATTHPSRRRL